MGMGFSPASATIIDTELFGKLPGTAAIWAELQAALKEAADDGRFEYNEYALGQGDPVAEEVCENEVLGQRIIDFVDRLEQAFEQATGVAMSVFYYKAEDGDRYDDTSHLTDGLNWAAEGIYELTPAAQKIESHLHKAQWTVFG